MLFDRNGNTVLEFETQKEKVEYDEPSPVFLSYTQYANRMKQNNDGDFALAYENDNGDYGVLYDSKVYGGILEIELTEDLPCVKLNAIFVDEHNIVKKHSNWSQNESKTLHGDINIAIEDYTGAMLGVGSWTGSGRIFVPEGLRCVISFGIRDLGEKDIILSGFKVKARSASIFEKKYDSLRGIVNLPEDIFAEYGLVNSIGQWVMQAKNEWMESWNWDNNKIPMIYTADQHSTIAMGKPLYDFVADIVPWANVSRIINLGDNIFNTMKKNGDTTQNNEPIMDKMKSVFKVLPEEKQVNIRGNHDLFTYQDNENPNGFLRKAKRSFTNQYYQTYGARYFDNATGDCVFYDDAYNVKYVVLNGWEYEGTDGTGTTRVYRNTSDQMDAIIRELERDDGYDIILLSHVPLFINKDIHNVVQTTDLTYYFSDYNWGIFEYQKYYAQELYDGLYNKTSGTVLDSDGNPHAFDFTGLNGNLLCAISGHTHTNGYYYVGGAGVLNLLSKNMYLENTEENPVIQELVPYKENNQIFNSFTITFALVDRTNNQVEVWNVSGGGRSTNEVYGLQKWVAPFKPEVVR